MGVGAYCGRVTADRQCAPRSSGAWRLGVVLRGAGGRGEGEVPVVVQELDRVGELAERGGQKLAAAVCTVGEYNGKTLCEFTLR